MRSILESKFIKIEYIGNRFVIKLIVITIDEINFGNDIVDIEMVFMFEDFQMTECLFDGFRISIILIIIVIPNCTEEVISTILRPIFELNKSLLHLFEYLLIFLLGQQLVVGNYLLENAKYYFQTLLLLLIILPFLLIIVFY